ncbi:MAG: ABC transporter permease [Prevotellaceae bacterium]|jgi:hypothetical protein|nr:ABC transporter permease [Prevotellaceae bacterium]
MKTYFRQAWSLVRQQRLFSTVYVIGTGLALTATMVLAMVFYIKMAPVYPEIHRDRMLTVQYAAVKVEGGAGRSSIGEIFVREYLYPLQTAEMVCAATNYGSWRVRIPTEATDDALELSAKRTDVNFWRVFGFRFLSGRPYTEEELRSEQKVVVIAQSAARRLFGDEEAVGRDVSISDGRTAENYRVVGVVADVSYVTPDSYAQIWLPNPKLYAVAPGTGNIRFNDIFGSCKVYLVAPSVAQMDEVIAEVNEVMQKINTSPPAEGEQRFELDLSGDLLPYWKSELKSTFHESNTHVLFSSFSWSEILKVLIPLLMAMLLVPALNMAGMVSSTMEDRLAEFGVRKVFGASRRRLMMQILAENLLLTLIGGIIGLLLSYAIMYFGIDWVLTLFNQTGVLAPEGAVTFYTADMLFNPFVFIIALFICLVLNYASAAIPAHMALRKDIVYSINKKR